MRALYNGIIFCMLYLMRLFRGNNLPRSPWSTKATGEYVYYSPRPPSHIHSKLISRNCHPL